MTETNNKPQRNVTLTDIAAEAGVSVATVSKSLSGDPKIREATRKKVRRIANRRGYIPDQHARTLRTKKSRRLGILLPTLNNPFYVEKVASAQETAWQAGYELAFVCSEWDVEREISCCNRFLGMGVEGVIVSNRVTKEENEHFNMIIERGMPVVDLTGENPAVPHASSIAVDRVKGMELIMQHLVELGHRSFGLVGFKPRPSSSYVHQLRWQGICNVLRRHEISNDCLELLPTADDSLESGYSALDCHLREGLDLPTALVTINDEIAHGALVALYDHGWKVPEDISVAGFDNTVTARFTRPALTTVSQTHLDLGRRAVEMLLEDIETPGKPPRHIKLEPKLVVRDSTAQVRLRPGDR